jgi:hypothetical protein
MNTAWLACPEEDRKNISSIPWENDLEPEKVGVWGENGTQGQMDTDDKPILRPTLRQRVPPELGYKPHNFNDDGNDYVKSFLLPESKRARVLLVAKIDALADELGGCKVIVPPLKTMRRMDEKAANVWGAEADHLLHELPCQASNVDVARVMLVIPTPALLIQAKRRLHELFTVLRVKNRFSPDDPLYGYRDMLINVDISGIIVEVQLGLAALVAVRSKMHKFYGVIRSTGFRAFVRTAKVLTAVDVGSVTAQQMATVFDKYVQVSHAEKQLNNFRDKFIGWRLKSAPTRAQHETTDDAQDDQACSINGAWNCDMCGSGNHAHRTVCN